MERSRGMKGRVRHLWLGAAVLMSASVWAGPAEEGPEPGAARNPAPASGQAYVDPEPVYLSWEAGAGVAGRTEGYVLYADREYLKVLIEGRGPERELRLGRDELRAALGETGFGETWYWRVDTLLRGGRVIRGAVWQLTTESVAIPGRVINYSDQPRVKYLMSPSLTILPDGTFIANHEYSGAWMRGRGEPARTLVFASRDGGRTWRRIARVEDQFWSSTFWLEGALYMMGIDARRPGPNVTIRRSTDGGRTWTEATDGTNGVLLTGERFHTGPVRVAVHGGRVWRSMEDRGDAGGWGEHFRAFVMSAPVGADLLQAANWTSTNRLSHDEEAWTGTGWLEGNVVVNPEGELVNVLRVSTYEPARGDVEKAAIVRVSADGTRASFDPRTGFIDMPGGSVRFDISFDAETGRYWSLVNKQRNPLAMRNRLYLCSSPDLREWTVHRLVLGHWDPLFHAWQYVDWEFDGEDMVFVSRTAHRMGGGVRANNYHDANFFTFHRIENFREALEERAEEGLGFTR